MKVGDVMMSIELFPVVEKTTLIKESLDRMNSLGIGIACVVDSQASNKLLGILTDGDIRRKLGSMQKPLSAWMMDDASVHMINAPLTVRPQDALVDAVALMGKKKIWDLPVISENDCLVGLLHLHPAVTLLLESHD